MSDATNNQAQSARTVSEAFHLFAQEERKKYKGKGKERATDYATDLETGPSMLEATATDDATHSDPGPSTPRVFSVNTAPLPGPGPSTPRVIAIADLTLPDPSPLRLQASAIEEITRPGPRDSVPQANVMEVFHIEDITFPDLGPSTLQGSATADIPLHSAGFSIPQASATNATAYPNPGPSILRASATTAIPGFREFPFPAVSPIGFHITTALPLTSAQPIRSLNRDAPVIGSSNSPNSYRGGSIGNPTQVLHVLPEDSSIWYTMGGVPHRIPISTQDHYAYPKITCIADECWVCSPSPLVQLPPGYVAVTAHMVRPGLVFALPRPEAIQPPAEPFYVNCVDPECHLCTPEYNATKLWGEGAWDEEEV
jgi:hypothetical protein